MIDYGLRVQGEGRSFRDCVQDCARDPRIVGAYNELYGTRLTAPILELLDSGEGQSGPNPETPEGAELALFIGFCYDSVWRYVQRAQQRKMWRRSK